MNYIEVRAGAMLTEKPTHIVMVKNFSLLQYYFECNFSLKRNTTGHGTEERVIFGIVISSKKLKELPANYQNEVLRKL